MEKHTKDSDHKTGDGFTDSLGQTNPAMDLEKKNIAAVKDRKEAEEKEAKKAEKAEK
jgi:hypothetical protein